MTLMFFSCRSNVPAMVDCVLLGPCDLSYKVILFSPFQMGKLTCIAIGLWTSMGLVYSASMNTGVLVFKLLSSGSSASFRIFAYQPFLGRLPYQKKNVLQNKSCLILNGIADGKYLCSNQTSLNFRLPTYTQDMGLFYVGLWFLYWQRRVFMRKWKEQAGFDQ